MNNDAPSVWPEIFTAERRVLEHQRKLHRWARTEPLRRFADLFNLVCDRATLLHAWERVAGNKGSMTAGIDSVTRFAVTRDDGLVPFLENLRSSLRDGSFAPLPVRPAFLIGACVFTDRRAVPGGRGRPQPEA